MDLASALRGIRLVCTDVDGVLTNGQLHYEHVHQAGSLHGKSFNVKDGAMIKWLQSVNIPVAFISGLSSQATQSRAQELGIVDCHLGITDKNLVVDQLLEKYHLTLKEVAYLGDDLQDLPVLQKVGFSACPSDAAVEVAAAVQWVVPIQGGAGVLRMVGEHLLKAQDSWNIILKKYNA